MDIRNKRISIAASKRLYIIPKQHKMASLLLRPMLRPQALGLGLGLSLYCTYQATTYRPHRLDTISSGSGSSGGSILSGNSYSRNAKTPVVREGGLNPAAIRQVSSGSIIGMYFYFLSLVLYPSTWIDIQFQEASLGTKSREMRLRQDVNS